MKQRSLQSKLFIAYLGMASLILFAFAAFFLSLCIRTTEGKSDQCHEHPEFQFQNTGRLCYP